jgi:tRNA A37 threonylcarbamoyladenosine modification protein TsaB
MPKKVDILLIALSSPVKIGIYENHTLVESIESEGKSSDVLPVLFQEILRKYEPQRLFYANGPGSFMAIKVAYIFLKSLSILKKIPLYATDAFYFNNNEPIKAIGKLYFVKIASKIETQKLDRAVATSFELPAQLDFSEFTTDTTPHYMIGAVG